MPRYTLDRAAIARIASSPGVAGRMEKLANTIKTEGQDVAPKRTHTLENSAYVENHGGHYQIGFDVDYAYWVNEGHHTRSGSFVEGQFFFDAVAFKKRDLI